MTDPLLIKDNDKYFYGGNQEWYSSNTKAFAGCGSVAAANVLRVLARRFPDAFGKGVADDLRELTRDDIEKDKFLALMGNIYKRMLVYEMPIVRRVYDNKERGKKPLKILSPSFGMSIAEFIRGVLRFARSKGLLLHVNALETAYCPYKKGLAFIEEGLRKSGAVVILTSLNKHPLSLYSGKCGELSNEYDYKSGMKSHFATITDIIMRDNEPILKISTWGRVASVSYRELNASWQKHRAFTSCIFYFLPVKSEAVVRADMRMAPIIYIKALIKGAFGGLMRLVNRDNS